ncbi:MAG: ATP-dependent rRNA helicase spb4 [Trizodia sp. TS-e1964]|nr:MAG: ATP-dependent rRNA helicase spb4 [Trizodia sp. TS-e1964]
MSEKTAKVPAATSTRAWEALTPPLSEWILDATSSMGFHRMTPVQASTIPLFIGNKDVVVEAVTGSGKTLAFLIPVVERLLRLEEPLKRHHVGAIIISPTRELATQIYSVLRNLLNFHPPSAVADPIEDGGIDGTQPVVNSDSLLKVVPQLLLGGDTTPAQDLSHFLAESPNLLISTPGRLLELISSPHVHCPQSSFEVLVLDEADRLLDLGFKADLQKILVRLPKQRRTGLFSASVSEAVGEIVRVGLRNPVKIAVKVKGVRGGEDMKTPASLDMTYVITPPDHKLAVLTHLLTSLSPQPQKSILYVSTCAAVDYFQHILPHLPISTSVIPLHGKHPPKVRQKNFTQFITSTTPTTLLTTDVAARGLDIPAVDLVIQLDPPSDPKAFLHRCGRAGRAGRAGLSVIFLHPGREEDYIPFLAVRQTPIAPLTPAISICNADAAIIEGTLHKTVLCDRAIHDKGQRAFVSWVQAYSKHQASSIFRVRDLDWPALARGWGLLRLPKMPELRGWEGDRTLGLSIDFETFAYRDKTREKLRKSALAAPFDAGAQQVRKEGKPRRKPSSAWSLKKEAHDERERRRNKRGRKREAERIGKMNPEELRKEAEMQRLVEEVRLQGPKEEFVGFPD